MQKYMSCCRNRTKLINNSRMLSDNIDEDVMSMCQYFITKANISCDF